MEYHNFTILCGANIKLHRKIFLRRNAERGKAVFRNGFVIIKTAVAINRGQVKPTKFAGSGHIDKNAGADKKNDYQHQ